MYQGKFDAKHKKTSTDVQELVAQRNAAPQKEASPRREAPQQNRNPQQRIQQPQQRTQQRAAQQPSRNPQAQSGTRSQAPARSQQPRQAAPQPVPQAPEKRGPRLGGVIFYTIYFLFIFLFFVGTFFGLQWLQGWLVDYEAAQPTTKSQEVFEALFSDPDWGALYDAAGIQDTAYEGKEAFVAYMENKVGDQELTFLETSAGLSGNKKYIVKLDSEKIAAFTLVGETDHLTDIPDWQFGSVELYYSREESFLIQLASGQTAYVNGVALDDSATIQIASTKADTTANFLPVGVTSEKTYTQQITGLMAVPTVTVQSKEGQEVPVSYDAETRTFTAQTESNTMSDTERDLALAAIKTYAEYGIKEASQATLAKYFDSTGEAFSNITKTVLSWTKGNNGYSFANDSVTGYARYSDSLFSVYATTEMTINLTDGGTQVKPINASLLFQKSSGTWKVIRMTNADVSQPVGQVRITFMDEDTELSSNFYDTDASELTAPVLSPREGQVFAGWIRKDGSEWSLVFAPDESGHVTIASGTTLEPMTLYAYFESADQNAGAAETTEGAA